MQKRVIKDASAEAGVKDTDPNLICDERSSEMHDNGEYNIDSLNLYLDLECVQERNELEDLECVQEENITDKEGQGAFRGLSEVQSLLEVQSSE